MQSKILTILVGIFVAVILFAGAFSGGVLVGMALPDTVTLPGLSSPSASSESTPVSREQLFEPFWQAWDLVHAQYVDQPVNDVTLMQGAISGMMSSLKDQHTAYMDPDTYRQQNTPLVGEYDGIGAWVDPTGDFLTIISPMPKSPAEEVGLKSGDKIIKVNDEDMTGIEGNLVLRRVLGPAGSSVKLTILRKGETKPFDIDVKRAKIVVPSVDGKMLDNDIAYVQLYTFGDKTTQDLKTLLKDLLAKKPKGMILDLRNNGGGYLKTAIEVVSQFVGKGVVMYEEYGDGHRETFNAQGNGLATDIPLVVLVNAGSASASEITAGAIQDYERAKLIGETTYGKGSVQNWIPLTADQGAVRITIARWLTPKERQIHKVGLKPDIEVPFTEDDAANDRDPQLDRAVQFLLTGE